MIYFPYVYTEEHLEQFYLEAQAHKEVLKQVQEIAKLPTLEAQVDAKKRLTPRRRLRLISTWAE